VSSIRSCNDIFTGNYLFGKSPGDEAVVKSKCCGIVYPVLWKGNGDASNLVKKKDLGKMSGQEGVVCSFN